MAYTTIDKPTDYFNTKLYTGTGSQLAVTGVGFQPDFVWFKNRGTTNSHGLQDVVRGFNTTGIQSSNGTDADPAFNGSTLGYVSAVGSDGFTVEAGGCANASGNNYVAWNWKAGGTASSNTDGSITSSVSANTTAGFSIVSYTGTGSTATVGHGLGITPSMIIVKSRNTTGRQWSTYHSYLGATKHIYLNATDAAVTSSSRWNDTAPTSSVFTVNTDGDVNGSGTNHIAYCFAEKKGYSKFGSYTGNGNADGTYIHLGFKASYIMIKGTGSGTNWFIQDNKRNPHNIVDKYFNADSNATDQSADMFDITANGIKQRNTFANLNGSGSTYIYMAFAENPFVSSGGIPCTAR